MTVARRVAVLATLALAGASCGDGTPPPTAPSALRTPDTLAILSTSAALEVGESQRLHLTRTQADGASVPPGGPVTWSSSNEAVMVVWPDGIALGLSTGEATISAVAGGQTTSRTFAVRQGSGDLRRIHGRLLDFATNSGVSGVVAEFVHGSPTTPATRTPATTGPSGAFEVALRPESYQVYVGDAHVGRILVRVGGPAFRGDLYVNAGNCISRYGTVIDAVTFRPVAGATVRYGGGSAESGLDGWYRIDHPCVGAVSGNTITVNVTHPEYAYAREFSGRGLMSVRRVDFELHRP